MSHPTLSPPPLMSPLAQHYGHAICIIPVYSVEPKADLCARAARGEVIAVDATWRRPIDAPAAPRTPGGAGGAPRRGPAAW
eukprot:310793-Pyramimonas_sp.AAC.1